MGISMRDFLHEYFMNQLYEFMAVGLSYFCLIFKRRRWCWSSALRTVCMLTRVDFCIVTQPVWLVLGKMPSLVLAVTQHSFLLKTYKEIFGNGQVEMEGRHDVLWRSSCHCKTLQKLIAFYFFFPFMPLWWWKRCSDCMSSVITDFCVAFSKGRDTRPNHYTNERPWEFLHYLSALTIGFNGRETQKGLISLCTQSIQFHISSWFGGYSWPPGRADARTFALQRMYFHFFSMVSSPIAFQ